VFFFIYIVLLLPLIVVKLVNKASCACKMQIDKYFCSAVKLLKFRELNHAGIGPTAYRNFGISMLMLCYCHTALLF